MTIPNLSAATNIEELAIDGCKRLVELPSLVQLKSLPSSQFINSRKNLKKFPELPRHLDWLSFQDTAIKEIPESIGYIHRLRELTLSNSRLKTVSRNICQLEFLEAFEVGRCPMSVFPEFLRNLKRFILCWNQIEEVPSSIGGLNQLLHLDMRGTRIHSLPTTVLQLDALTEILLSYCPNITNCPNVLENIKLLFLDDTPIQKVPSSISRLKSLSCLSMSGCTRLTSLSTSICKLKSPKRLFLGGCSNLECFPEILETMESLIHLDLSRTVIKVLLPSSFSNLIFLKELRLSRSDIMEIPEGFKQLSSLICLYLCCCKRLKSLLQLPPSLRILAARDCKSLERVSNLEQFQYTKAHICLLMYDYPLTYICFLFINCLKMDRDALKNIAADAQLRIQGMAEKFAMESYEGSDHVYDKSVFYCFSGSQIPETFKYQSTNSSITVESSPACSHKRFLCFILCIVVDFGHQYDSGNFRVECRFRLKSKCGDHRDFAYSRSEHFSQQVRFESTHVMLLFDGFESGTIETSGGEHFDEASFEFYVESASEWSPKLISVQKCGVNVFYVDAVRSNDRQDDWTDDGKGVESSTETLKPSCALNQRDSEVAMMEKDEEAEKGADEIAMVLKKKRSLSCEEEEEAKPERAKYCHPL